MSNLQNAEVALDQEEQGLKGKKEKLEATEKEVAKATSAAQELQAKFQEEMGNSEHIDINEGNVLMYVKPSDELQGRWLLMEAKKKSIEECIQTLKKFYEDKTITLAVLLDAVRRLSLKEFMCIYKKEKLEKHTRRIQQKQ